MDFFEPEAEMFDGPDGDAAGVLSEPPALAGGFLDFGLEDETGDHDISASSAVKPIRDESRTLNKSSLGDATIRDPKSKIELSGLKSSFDGYGREIFVEEETNEGRPMIWYQFNAKGKINRMERKGYAISVERWQPSHP